MQERSSLLPCLPWGLGKNNFSCPMPREGTPKEPLGKLGCLNPPPTLETILSEGLADGRHCWWRQGSCDGHVRGQGCLALCPLRGEGNGRH